MDGPHAEMVKRAERWLRGRMKCGVVLTECSGGWEIPDAVGWRLGGRECHLVECKVSRADFLADRKKFSRAHGSMAGNFCWYMVPAGLVKVAEVPPGWGLVEVTGEVVKMRKRAPRRWNPGGDDIEKGYMFSELRKVQIILAHGKLPFATRADQRLRPLAAMKDATP